jgi:glycine/D-amino acid oxidase-like deaminating enzyme
MATTADAVVVGAGVIGASVALELARSGRRVVCVDKAAAPGLGSTSASSAIVRFNYSTRDGVALAWEAKHGWESWAEHLDAAAGEQLARFRRTGLVMLDSPLAPREPVLRHFDDVGVPYDVWDAARLRAHVPGLDPGRFGPPKPVGDDAFWSDADGELGAFFTPDAGYVDDPQLAAQNLAAAAQRHGARYLLRRAVTGLTPRTPTTGGALWTIVTDTGEVLEAPVVVNAAGPWSGRLNELAGAGDDFGVTTRPLRQEVHHVPAPADFDGAAAVALADVDLGTYLRPTGDGHLLVGGTEPECDDLEWVDDLEAVDYRPTTGAFEAQVTRAARRLPGLRVPGQPRGVVGVYDVTDDWAPIYDKTSLPGFYVAIGTSGNQFKNAPVVGRVMATIVGRVEGGHDHDREPVSLELPRTGHTVDLSAYSRLRTAGAGAARSVLG